MIDPNIDVAEYYKKKRKESIPHRINEIVSTLNLAFYTTEKHELESVLEKSIKMINKLKKDLQWDMKK